MVDVSEDGVEAIDPRWLVNMVRAAIDPQWLLNRVDFLRAHLPGCDNSGRFDPGSDERFQEQMVELHRRLAVIEDRCKSAMHANVHAYLPRDPGDPFFAEVMATRGAVDDGYHFRS